MERNNRLPNVIFLSLMPLWGGKGHDVDKPKILLEYE